MKKRQFLWWFLATSAIMIGMVLVSNIIRAQAIVTGDANPLVAADFTCIDPRPVQGRIYAIMNVSSGFAMDVLNNGGSGASVAQYPFYGGANQEWQFTPLGDGLQYKISPMHAQGLYLSIQGDSQAEGAQIEVSSSLNSTMNWAVLGNGILQFGSLISVKYIGVQGGSNTPLANIVQYSDGTPAYMHWQLYTQPINGACPSGSTPTATSVPPTSTNTQVPSTATPTNTYTNTPMPPTATATRTPTNTPIPPTSTATPTSTQPAELICPSNLQPSDQLFTTQSDISLTWNNDPRITSCDVYVFDDVSGNLLIGPQTVGTNTSFLLGRMPVGNYIWSLICFNNTPNAVNNCASADYYFDVQASPITPVATPTSTQVATATPTPIPGSQYTCIDTVPVTGRTYMIVNANGSLMDVSGAGTSSGTNVILHTIPPAGPNPNQLWQFTENISGGIFPMHAPNLRLAPLGESSQPGDKLVVSNITGSSAQVWTPVSIGQEYVRIGNVGNKLFANVNGAANQTPIIQSNLDTNLTSEKWQLKYAPTNGSCGNPVPTATATPSNTPIIPTVTPEIVTLSGSVGVPEVFPRPSVSSYTISAVDTAGRRYTATTDSNSNYVLRVQKEGNYKITIQQPNGYIVRFADAIGGNDFVFRTTVEVLADQNKSLPSALVGPCVSPFTGLDICSLKKGDIILLDRSSTGNDLLSNSFGSYWLHAALVGDDTNIIEAQSTDNHTTDVIVHFPLFTTSYLDQNTNNFVVLRIKEKYQSYIDAAVLKAVQWASDPTVSYVKNPLDILQDTSLKQQRKQFYCSMFVWAAYFDATGGTLDLDSDKGIMREQTILNSLWLDLARKQIFPDDLFATTITSGKTYDGRDYEATTDMVLARQIDAEMIKTILFSPMDILLTDAQGRRVGYDPVLHKIVNEIPGAYYTGPDSEPETINFKSSGAAPYKITLTGTDTGDAVFGFQTMTMMGMVESAAVQLTSVVTGTTYTFTANQSNGTPELTLGEPGAVIYPLYLPLIKK